MIMNNLFFKTQMISKLYLSQHIMESYVFYLWVIHIKRKYTIKNINEL